MKKIILSTFLTFCIISIASVNNTLKAQQVISNEHQRSGTIIGVGAEKGGHVLTYSIQDMGNGSVYTYVSRETTQTLFPGDNVLFSVYKTAVGTVLVRDVLKK